MTAPTAGHTCRMTDVAAVRYVSTGHLPDPAEIDRLVRDAHAAGDADHPFALMSVGAAFDSIAARDRDGVVQ